MGNLDDTAVHLRSSQSGRKAHTTRRMNIVSHLMADKDFVEEVKGNMMNLNESLEDFNAVHASYAELLDQEQRKEDDEK